MRPFHAITLTLLVSVSLAASVPAQSVTTATNPVGFISSSVAANSSAALSFPLDNLPDFSGAVSSFTTTTITTTGAGWTTNQFGSGSFNTTNTNPHVVRMITGALTGRHFKISGNTGTASAQATDTLTITGTPNLTGIAAGDQYQIIAVNTLGSVFGTANANLKVFGPNATTDKIKTDASNAVADNVLINVAGTWLTFWNTGSQWQRVSGGTGSQNLVVLMPEQGFLFVRHDTVNPLPAFTALGAVPIANNLVTDLPGSTNTFLANRFPIDMKLTTIAGPPVQPGLDLNADPNWVKNANANLADNLLLNVNGTWLTYWHTGPSSTNQWQRVSGGTGAQNPTIKAGTAMLIVRRGSNPIVFSQTRPYGLN